MAPCSVGEKLAAIFPGCWAANSDVFEEDTLIAGRKHRGIDRDSLYFVPRLGELIRIGSEVRVLKDESGPRPEVHSAEAQASSELGGTNPSLTAFRFK